MKPPEARGSQWPKVDDHGAASMPTGDSRLLPDNKCVAPTPQAAASRPSTGRLSAERHRPVTDNGRRRATGLDVNNRCSDASEVTYRLTGGTAVNSHRLSAGSVSGPRLVDAQTVTAAASGLHKQRRIAAEHNGAANIGRTVDLSNHVVVTDNTCQDVETVTTRNDDKSSPRNDQTQTTTTTTTTAITTTTGTGDLDVINVEPTLPEVNWDKLEEQLRSALQLEQLNQVSLRYSSQFRRQLYCFVMLNKQVMFRRCLRVRLCV